MRPYHRPFLPVLLLIAAACAGTRARDHVLLPTLKSAWPAIAADVTVGIAAGVSGGQMTPAQGTEAAAEAGRLAAALDGADPVAASLINWPGLVALARSGIAHRAASGQIGPGVVASLDERVRQFGLSLTEFSKAR